MTKECKYEHRMMFTNTITLIAGWSNSNNILKRIFKVQRLIFAFLTITDMLILSRNHHCATMCPNLQIRINKMASMLLMNEIQISYWHALNMSKPELWT